MSRAFGGAWLVLAAAATLPAGGVAQPIGIRPPSPAGEKVVLWSRPPTVPRIPAGAASLRALLSAAHSPAESVAAWREGLSDTLLRSYVLRRVAALHVAAGDTARADRAWALLAAERTPWQWEAVRARAELALARGMARRADSLLERAERGEWTEADRAEWLARRIDAKLALGDSAAAATATWQMVTRYPSDPRAGRALATFESLLAARGDSPTPAQQEAAAEVDRLRGRRVEAAARLAVAAAALGMPDLQLRRARLLREARRFPEAREAAAAALQASRSAADTLDVFLERARLMRDTGDDLGALRLYAEAGRLGPSPWWQRGRLLEGRGDWGEARADYARVVAMGDSAALGRRLGEQAAFRAGLMSLAVGDRSAALGWFARGGSEGSRFWQGVVLRGMGSPGGDSLLRVVAAQAGFAFYRSAARETLGVRGWPAASRPMVPPASRELALRLAQALDGIGCGADAAFILERWAAGDPRLGGSGAVRRGREWLAGAAIAYAGDRLRQAIRLAERATASFADSATNLGWAASPWLYPPAYDSLFAAYPESAAAGQVERALLQALAWKESAFDPRARSRSDALGLLQLQRPAVTDVARWRRERAPADSALADPALNLRYGAAYFERLLSRFPGDLPLALAAYNAGPTVAKRWSRLRAIGGDALACEEIDYPETQDYVKSVLAARQAYRELRPALAR